jgi:hypothetical protein
MNRSRAILATLGVVVLTHGVCETASAAGNAYRWVDKNGVVHYGDTVPPEFAAQGQAELNNQGVALRQTPRQMSPSEMAAAERAAAEVAKRQQRDVFLLSTYTRIKDIEQLRDERLALIEGQMEVARGSITVNDQRLTSLQERMRNFQPYSSSTNARRLPDQLAEEVVRALKEQRSLREVLTSRETEKLEMRAEFDADIERFRELSERPALR